MSLCSATAPETIVKQPSEIRQYTMDFASVLSGSETISSISSIAVELRGGGVSDLTVYNEEKGGDTTVTFWASGGTNNTTHRVEIIVVTSAIQTIEGDGIISVRDK